jgi:hypothetical protein
MTVPKHDVGVCIVCLLRHNNIGYSPTPRHPVGWFCTDCLDTGIDAIKKAYHMSRKQLDVYEERAVEAGSEEAGAYLDGLGKSDLADLEKHEWLEMWRRGLLGYANEMQKMMSENAPPF